MQNGVILSISDSFFPSDLWQLKKLSIKRCSLQTMPVIDLVGATLEVLEVLGNINVSHIADNYFQNATALKSVDLSSNGVSL